MSVCGDAFGQRVARVDFKFSRRRMMMMMSIVTAVQIFVLLGITELAFPHFTGVLYVDDKRATCYRETDIDHRTLDCAALVNTTHPCTEITCPAQGPFSFWPVIYFHPAILLNGLLDLVYYSAEFMLYKEALGLVLLVVASLASSFLVGPVGEIFSLPPTKPIPPFVYVLGISGALLTLVERPVRAAEPEAHKAGRGAGEEGLSINASTTSEIAPLLGSEGAPEPGAGRTRVKALLGRWLSLLVPFVLLSIVYALWFVTQVYFNDRYRLNLFGYTSVDQVLLPFFIFPYLWIVDVVGPFKRLIENDIDQRESFGEAFRGALGDVNLATMFAYRLLINGRAMIYFFMSVQYDLSLVYLELTLVRIMMSWLGSIVLVLAAPRLIHASPHERATVLHPLNLALKLAGSTAIVLSLLILNKAL